MKNLAKLIAVCVFGLAGLAVMLSGGDLSNIATRVSAQVTGKPTPPANSATNANAAVTNVNAANKTANTATASTPVAGGKTITKSFVLGKDSLSEYGESPFDHETHAFKNYSPDGKSQIACVECHHTDQPKSALKPPLSTSERDTVLTFDVWKTSSQKVSECRSCHFQDGNVPDEKEMPTATYNEGGKSVTKDLNNELAYHINCNNCHDAAFALRPDLKKKPGFATAKDCTICHKKN